MDTFTESRGLSLELTPTQTQKKIHRQTVNEHYICEIVMMMMMMTITAVQF